MTTNHVDRMVGEKKMLEERIEKLNNFIVDDEMFHHLPVNEQVLMIKQLGFMEAYCACLKERLMNYIGE